MQPNTPRRLTGAALLLTLLLTLWVWPTPAAATDPFDMQAPRAEQAIVTQEPAETGWVAWLADTWNQLRIALPNAIRGGGEGHDGGERNSGMDPNGHDRQVRQR